jgi:integral membrane protein
VNALRLLRLVAFLEGLSFVGLLFIAVPLKHLAGLPFAVHVIGSVHGFLFVLFLGALLRASIERQWPPQRSWLAFASSLIPFGTFVFDQSLRREIANA